jgi:hypothetical protein
VAQALLPVDIWTVIGPKVFKQKLGLIPKIVPACRRRTVANTPKSGFDELRMVVRSLSFNVHEFAHP